MYKLFGQNENKLIYTLVGAIPVSGEIQEWPQSLVIRLNWLNEFCQRSLAADDFFERPRWTRWTLSSLRYVSSHFLFDTSAFPHGYFIVPLRDTRLTILTGKELRYNLLTFTIFIIQLFSRLSVFEPPPFSMQLTEKKLGESWTFNNMRSAVLQKRKNMIMADVS